MAIGAKNKSTSDSKPVQTANVDNPDTTNVDPESVTAEDSGSPDTVPDSAPVEVKRRGRKPGQQAGPQLVWNQERYSALYEAMSGIDKGTPRGALTPGALFGAIQHDPAFAGLDDTLFNVAAVKKGYLQMQKLCASVPPEKNGPIIIPGLDKAGARAPKLDISFLIDKAVEDGYKLDNPSDTPQE